MDKQTLDARAKAAAKHLAPLLEVDERLLAMHLEQFGSGLLDEVRAEMTRTLERALARATAINERGPALREQRATEQLMLDASRRRLAAIDAQLGSIASPDVSRGD